MSQTETLMVLGLGAAVTLVFVLLFGRFLWSWSVRASTRRQSKQVPIEMLELQADRDRLRAEHAVMARKLDLRLDDIKIRMAEQMAEVSRNRNRVQTLLHDLEQKDSLLRIRTQENTNLQAQLDTSRAELDAAHRSIETLSSDASRHDADLARLQEAFRKLSTKLRDRESVVTDLSGELRAALSQDNVTSNVFSGDLMPSSAERMRKRTAEITSISADMNRSNDADRSSTDDLLTGIFLPKQDSQTAPLSESTTARLQEKMDQTVSMNDDLQRELSAIDKLIGQSATHDPKTDDMPATKRTGTVANVISLAQRIRALQKGFDE